MRTVSSEVTGRPAEVGELCTCGRQAVTVYLGGQFGATGDCGLRDGGQGPDGVCTFCGDTVDHDHYARTEQAAGRENASWNSDGQAQSGRCPLYRLRLADPLPQLHPESVRPFDPAADRLERAPRRLTVELAAIVEDARRAAGVAPWVAGQLGELVISLEIAGEQIIEHLAEHGDRAAVLYALDVTVESLTEVGDTGPAAGQVEALDLDTVIAALGETWGQTDPVDRPLLVLRRAVRRTLNPEVPADHHREWWV